MKACEEMPKKFWVRNNFNCITIDFHSDFRSRDTKADWCCKHSAPFCQWNRVVKDDRCCKHFKFRQITFPVSVFFSTRCFPKIRLRSFLSEFTLIMMFLMTFFSSRGSVRPFAGITDIRMRLQICAIAVRMWYRYHTFFHISAFVWLVDVKHIRKGTGNQWTDQRTNRLKEMRGRI